MDVMVGEAFEQYKRLLNASKSYDGLNSKERKKTYLKLIEDSRDLNIRLFSQLGSNLGYYTSHGPDHSARVMRHAISLVNLLKEFNTKLNLREIFILGLSIYLHDLGMTAPLSTSELNKCKNENDKWNLKRKKHADSIEYILNQESTHSLAHLKETEPVLFDKFLINVCRAHSAKNFSPCIDLFKASSRSDPNVRYALIAGLLLFADEMDIIRNRADIRFNLYNEFDDLTKAHWWKHWLVENCYLDKNVFRIVHVSSKKINQSIIFSDWTKLKIEKQIELLKQELDPTNTSIFSHLVINVVEDGDLPNQNLPAINRSIVNEAQKEILYLRESHEFLLNDPVRIIDRVKNKDEHLNSSEAYQKIIAPNIAIFRGQGVHSTEHSIFNTYVWIDKNSKLLNNLLNHLKVLLQKRKSPKKLPKAGDPHSYFDGDIIKQARNLEIITGNVGVGKTHFLGMFLEMFKKEHFDLYNRSIFIRCETTECVSLLDIKREIAKSLISELNRLNIYDDLKNASDDTELNIYIPLMSELLSLTEDEIENFILSIGLLVDGPDGLKLFKEKAPIAICLFLDNTDRLPEHLLSDIYDWSYNFGAKGCLYAMIFYRPSSLDREIARKAIAYDYRSTRTPFTVYAPPLKDVISKRIKYLFSLESISETKGIFINDLENKSGMRIKISDFKDALIHLCSNLVKSQNDLLPNFCETNIRLLLQSFIRVLSSWVMDSNTIFINLFSGKSNTYRMVGWPRMLEALMVGHRKWYNPSFSPIENLFHPPLIEHFADYFIVIHLMQIIDKYTQESSENTGSNGIKIRDIHIHANNIGYLSSRIDRIIQWLLLTNSHEEGKLDYYRIRPLITICSESNKDYDIFNTKNNNELEISLSMWGKYHLSKLIYQLRYWKHIHYDMIIPSTINGKIIGDETSIIEIYLFDNLKVVFDFLGEIESNWFSSRPNAKSIGVSPIISNIKEEINKQKMVK
jgi:hypothetical protein